MPRDDTSQKTTKVTWSCDKDTWKHTSPEYFTVNYSVADVRWGSEEAF